MFYSIRKNFFKERIVGLGFERRVGFNQIKGEETRRVCVKVRCQEKVWTEVDYVVGVREQQGERGKMKLERVVGVRLGRSLWDIVGFGFFLRVQGIYLRYLGGEVGRYNGGDKKGELAVYG